MNEKYSALRAEIKELETARQTIYDYYREQQKEQERKRKNGELE